MSLAWEENQTAALVISGWLREYLKLHPGDKVERAMDILELAQWYIAGPGWGAVDTQAKCTDCLPFLRLRPLD